MASQPIRVDLTEDLDAGANAAGVSEDDRPETRRQSDAGLRIEETESPEIHLDHLRRLLLGYDDERLDRLQGWLNDPSYRAAEISQILPRAVRLRAEGDPELGEALGPTIETALVDYFRRDPEAAARVLAPVVGAAIRGAICARLARPLRALRLAATMPGLRWWVESRHSGVSFAEVADQHTLVYRIEYVLLYHRASGTLLVEVENPDSPRLSRPELAAALARVRVMFGMANPGDEELAAASAKLGIVMEQGPRLVLIALVRGNAPERLQDRLTGVLDAIHIERRLSLKTFAGDTAAFQLCRPLLEKLLAAEYSEPQARRAVWLGTAALAATIAAVVWYLKQ